MHEVHTTNVLRDFYVEIHKTKKSTQIHSSHFTFLHWVLHLTNYLQIPAKFTAPARCTRNSHGYHHFQFRFQKFRSIQGEPSSSSSASLASPRLPAPTTSRGSQIHASSPPPPSTRSPPPGNGHRREDRRGLRLRHRHGPLLLRHAPPVGFSALAPLEFGSVWVFARSAMA